MLKTWRIAIFCLAFPVAGSALAALVTSAEEEVQANRALLTLYRRDPASYARLCLDQKAFDRLPEETRARMRHLDHELREESSAAQVRLLSVGKRYARWLATLPAEQRRTIESISDKAKRLESIREIRKQQWRENLPQAQREHLREAKGDVVAEVMKIWLEQRYQRHLWQVATAQWDDLAQHGPYARLDQLPHEVQDFVKDKLIPQLNKDDKERLSKAEGNWYKYPKTLLELSEKSTYAFRMLMPEKGPSRMEDLPENLRKHFLGRQKLIDARHLQLASGKWPDFAFVVCDIAKRNNFPITLPLGPAFPKDFPKPIREFIIEKLMSDTSSVLTREERKNLRFMLGNWPLFPSMVLELARKHHLRIPGASLPGEFWDHYRSDRVVPNRAEGAVSDGRLRVFVMLELQPGEREALGPNLNDRSSRQRLQALFAERHADEWEKLLAKDQENQATKKSASK